MRQCVCHDTLPWLISFSLDAVRTWHILRDCGAPAALVSWPTEWDASYFGFGSRLLAAGYYRPVVCEGRTRAWPQNHIRFWLVSFLPLAGHGADLPLPDARFTGFQHYRLVLRRFCCCHSIRAVHGLSMVSPAMRAKASNQSMKPTAPWRNAFSEIATTPCRGLSLSR
jgi:hypothetical protein